MQSYYLRYFSTNRFQTWQKYWFTPEGGGGGGGLLLGIIGGGVPPGSPNPNLISDQKMPSSTLVFRPGLYAEVMSSLLRLERKQKSLQMHFEFAYFYFVLIHLELKRQLHSYAPVVPSKTIPDSRPKLAKCIPVFTPKRPKNHTLWGNTYLYGLYKGVPPLSFQPC